MKLSSVEDLELQALEQRNRLHQSTEELWVKLASVRDKLNVSKQAREHFLGALLFASVVGLGLGYGFAGIFTRR
jgi:hypothetical protein